METKARGSVYMLCSTLHSTTELHLLERKFKKKKTQWASKNKLESQTHTALIIQPLSVQTVGDNQGVPFHYIKKNTNMHSTSLKKTDVQYVKFRVTCK